MEKLVSPVEDLDIPDDAVSGGSNRGNRDQNPRRNDLITETTEVEESGKKVIMLQRKRVSFEDDFEKGISISLYS